MIITTPKTHIVPATVYNLLSIFKYGIVNTHFGYRKNKLEKMTNTCKNVLPEFILTIKGLFHLTTRPNMIFLFKIGMAAIIYSSYLITNSSIVFHGQIIDLIVFSLFHQTL